MPHVRYDKNGLNSYHLSAYLFVFDFFTCVFLVQFYLFASGLNRCIIYVFYSNHYFWGSKLGQMQSN